MENLLGKNLDALRDAARSCGLNAFVGNQIADWMYKKRAVAWEQMVNISKASKQALQEKYALGAVAPTGSAVSSDGTKKYLFPVECVISENKTEKSFVEAVMIPEEERKTLCVSSQAGCKMACRFCMTGRQGWHGNLSIADILNQFLSVDESNSLSNAVFMGMGEPLDNYDAVSGALEVLTAPWGFAWSPKRITLSTIGVLPALKRFLDEQRCHLAISLHNPFPTEREEFMPVQKAFDEKEIIELLRSYDFSGQRRVSFEYTMFSGWNDTKLHADALIRLLKGLECRVNLIRFHEIPNFPYQSSSLQAMAAFRDRLDNNGITCTIRASRGEDILAACGMLAGKH
jgi:23S rRNA (adenine2503-C2)-methyltransferase